MNKKLVELPMYKKVIALLIICGITLLFFIFLSINKNQTQLIIHTTQDYTADMVQFISRSFSEKEIELLLSDDRDKSTIVNVFYQKVISLHKTNSELFLIMVDPIPVSNAEVRSLVYLSNKAGKGSTSLLSVSPFFIEQLEKARESKKLIVTEPVAGMFENTIYGFYPILNSNNEVLAVTILANNFDAVNDQLDDLYAYSFLIFIIILIAIGFSLAYLLNKELLPISNIMIGINEFSKGNFKFQISKEQSGEYEEIIASLNEMIAKIRVLFQQLNEKTTELEIEKKEIILDPVDNAMRDIDEIVNNLQEQKYYQQTEKINAIGQLAASVAHEIRNPLTVIKGFIQLFERRMNLSFEEQSILGLMTNEVERAEAIINDYLSLAKPEVQEVSVINVKELIYKVYSLMQSYAVMNNNVEIELDILSEVKVKGNSNELLQVLLNIVKNGVEAMGSGGIITVRLLKDEEYCSIYISDTGIGMSEEQLNRLGTPFYSLKEKGTGIGMMVCYQIVKKMNGSIDVSSEVNVGTTFKISLPIYKH